MKYDLHVHTSRYSPCAVSPPEAICRAALESGLDGLALTEHDFWWSRDELEKLRRQFPRLAIFRGVEYSLPEGHFLIFLPDPDHQNFPHQYNLLNLAMQVHRLAGMVIWAHPFRYDRSVPGWLNHVRLDGIEVASNNMSGSLRRIAENIGQRRQIPMFQNSDAHHVNGLGEYYNELPVCLKDNRDLVDYLKTASMEQWVGTKSSRQ